MAVAAWRWSAVREPPRASFGHLDGPCTGGRGDRRGVGAPHLGGHPALDDLLGGDHRGGGVAPLARVIGADECDGVGMAEDPGDHLGQLRRISAVEGGDDGHDDVARREDLALGEGPLGPQDRPCDLVDLGLAQARSGAVPGQGRVGDRGQDLAWGKPDGFELGPPLGQQLVDARVALVLAGVPGRDGPGLVGGVALGVDRLVDLGPAFGMDGHGRLGDPGDLPVAELAGGPGVGLDGVPQLGGRPGGL